MCHAIYAATMRTLSRKGMRAASAAWFRGRPPLSYSKAHFSPVWLHDRGRGVIPAPDAPVTDIELDRHGCLEATDRWGSVWALRQVTTHCTQLQLRLWDTEVPSHDHGSVTVVGVHDVLLYGFE
eukprot:scaffold159592_cov32-Tisochrysis_lutea.AAC.5